MLVSLPLHSRSYLCDLQPCCQVNPYDLRRGVQIRPRFLNVRRWIVRIGGWVGVVPPISSVSTFVRAPSARSSSSPLNSRLQIRFLVEARVTGPLLFHDPWASLSSFSIPTLSTGAVSIPSRAGSIPSMSNTLIYFQSSFGSLRMAALMAYVGSSHRSCRLWQCAH